MQQCYSSLKTGGSNAFALIVALLVFVNSAAFAQCGTCTITVNSNTGALVLFNNSVVCITFQGTYTGTINVNNATNVRICVSSGTTISNSANFQNPGGGINVDNSGIWQKDLLVQSARTFTNNAGATVSAAISLQGTGVVNNAGSWNAASFTMSGGTVTNSGSFSLSSAFSPTGGVWSGTGSVSLASFSPNAGTFTFSGPTSISGAVNMNSGPSVSFMGATTIGGGLSVAASSTLQVGNTVSVTGNITNMGTIHVPSTAPSCNALCPTGTFSNTNQITAASGKSLNLCQNPGGTLGAGVNVVSRPTAQPTGLTVTQGITDVQGSFTPASGSPAGYLVLSKASAFTASDLPVYGGTYTPGQAVGGATVAAITTGTTFSATPQGCGSRNYVVVSMNNGTASCAAYASGLGAEASTTITTVPGEVTGGYTICSGDAMTPITLVNQQGDVVRWEYSDNGTFSDAAIINGTVTAYTPTHTSGTRWYRAVVRAGSCSELPALATAVTVQAPSSTTWQGTSGTNYSTCNNWSSGRPISSSAVTINGGVTNTLTLDQDATWGALNFGTGTPSTATLNFNGRTLTITGSVNLASGATLTVNNGTLVLAGTVTGAGQLTCSGTGNIIVSGTGALGTLNFAAGTELQSFTLNRSGGSATLGSGMKVRNAFNLQAGTLNVGANLLELEGPIAITGSLATQAGSSLAISGSGGVTGFTMPASLTGFTFNRAAASIALANNTAISGAFTLLSGTLSLGTRTLTLSGPISGGGTLSTTSSSSLTINGSGTVTDFFIPAALNNLTVNRSGLTLGANQDMTIDGTVTMTSGMVNTGTYIMTLGGSGSITETDASHVRGFLRTSRTVGLLGASTFGGMGFSILSGLGNLGVVTVTRRSGHGSAVVAPPFRSVNTVFKIEKTGSDPILGRLVDFRWFASNDNANDFGLIEAFMWARTSENGAWSRVPLSLPLSTLPTERSAQGSVVPFYEITVADWDNPLDGAPLPVELASFTAKRAGPDLKLNWTTLQEINNAGFSIHTSLTGTQYDSVAYVQGKGTTSGFNAYQLTLPENAATWVRLVQHDLDGKKTNLGSVYVAPAHLLKKVELVYSDAEQAISFRNTEDLQEVHIYDASGHRVWSGAASGSVPFKHPVGLYTYWASTTCGPQSGKLVVH